MAVVAVRELWEQRRASEDQKGKRDYYRAWGVTTNSTLTGQISVKAAVPVVRFQRYTDADGTPDPYGAFAQKIEAKQTDDPLEWVVEAFYSNRTDQPQLGNESPTQRVPEVEWDWEQFQRPVESDIDGNAIVNSAGERYDPPVEIDDSRLVLKITNYVASYNPLFYAAFKDAVNADVFYGFPPGTVKAKAPTAVRQFENGIYYYKVSYVFYVRLDGWVRYLLDQGFYYQDAAGNTYRFTDQVGNPLASPALLNGEGQPLSGAKTTLTAVALVTDQQIHVTGLTGFPQLADTLPYDVIVDGEVMTVTDIINQNLLAVRRGQAGTTRAQHASGAGVAMMPYFQPFVVYPSVKFAPLGLD